MDVVYPYKKTEDELELRFSLRSLVNMPHDRVLIAGDRPRCSSDNVVHIDVPPMDDRYQSSTANILAAIEAGASDDFIVMHDDIFVLRQWEFRHEHRCSIDEYLRTGTSSGDYRAMVERTRDILKAHGVANPLFFGLHTPTVYNGRRVGDLVKEFAGQGYLLRTLYHNLFPAQSQRREDVKVRAWAAGPIRGDVLSISDHCAGSFGFREWIARLFPERSRYEFAPTGPCLILGYASTVWEEAAAALERTQFEAVIASPEAAARWPGKVLAVASDDRNADRLAALYGFDEVVWCGRSEKAAA